MDSSTTHILVTAAYVLSQSYSLKDSACRLRMNFRYTQMLCRLETVPTSSADVITTKKRPAF